MRPQGQDLRPGTELLGRKRRLLKREAGRSSGLSFLEGPELQGTLMPICLVCPSAGVPMLSVQPKGKQKGCAGCNRKIKDRYLLKALDKYWHEDCLKCACCDCRLGEVGSTLYTKANLILCRRDYLRWATSCHLALLLREPPSSSTQRGPTLAFNLGPKVPSLLCAHPRLSWPCLAFRDTP